MHIVLCHHALIPPRKYGGTERVVYWLGKALVSLGHKVTLIAREGSQIPGAAFIPFQEGKSWEELAPKDADILHLRATPSQVPRKPHVVTIDGNGQPGEKFLPNTLFLSRKHAENHGAKYFVYNGIDPDDYPCDETREESLVFLAKASWSVKNLQGAIQIARAAGMKLHVLGSRSWPLGLQHLSSFLGKVHYHGMVGDEQKKQVLRKARALLFPVRWHEPFGLAVTEALASGCAVFGTPYGSLPEIVTPEVGFLSSEASQIVAKLTGGKSYSPAKCRQRVYEGFTHLDMANGYLKFYRSVLETGRLGEGVLEDIPRTAPTFRAKELLSWQNS